MVKEYVETIVSSFRMDAENKEYGESSGKERRDSEEAEHPHHGRFYMCGSGVDPEISGGRG